MSIPARFIACSAALLWAGASQAQLYARFGSPLENSYDKRSYASADISPDLPACKRNDAAWWAQVQRYEQAWNDPRRTSNASWWSEQWAHTVPHFEDWPRTLRTPSASTPKGEVPVFSQAQGVSWLDIDGDGWCDVLLSTAPEAAKRPGLPVILAKLSAVLFFDPSSKTFKAGNRGDYLASYRGGEVTSAFTLYYNRKMRRVETVERTFSSGMHYSSQGWEALHGKLMLKGATLTEPLCNKAGDGSEACIAYTVMNEEFGRVLDALSENQPREAAIRQELMEAAERAAKAKPPR